MHPRYDDILSKISERPEWFDEHAVPRYCPFEPTRCADIHCSEAVLAEIACQACGHLYKVAFSRGKREAKQHDGRWLRDDIVEKTLHYGDPPNACCVAGAPMNSVPRRVLEYWRRHDRPTNDPAYATWHRDRSLEIDIEPEWAKDLRFRGKGERV